MKPGESLGKLLGHPLALVAGTVSFLRNSRTFHPSGIMVQCEVIESDIKLHPYAMVRFSGAIWKHSKILPDVLGIAIRFSRKPASDEKPLSDDQDLLFASFRHPLQTPLAPILSNPKKFQKNKYYAISPFLHEGKKRKYKLTLENWIESEGDRDINLRINIDKRSTLYMWQAGKGEQWQKVAELKMVHELNFDQELIFFNPFRNGLNISPMGFIHFLRFSVYPISQFGRTLRHRFKKELHHGNNSFIINRL